MSATNVGRDMMTRERIGGCNVLYFFENGANASVTCILLLDFVGPVVKTSTFVRPGFAANVCLQGLT